MKTFDLKREGKVTWGFSIAGDRNVGYVLKSINPTGIAAKAGCKNFQKIVSINDTPFKGLKMFDVLKIIKSATDSLVICVEDDLEVVETSSKPIQKIDLGHAQVEKSQKQKDDTPGTENVCYVCKKIISGKYFMVSDRCYCLIDFCCTVKNCTKNLSKWPFTTLNDKLLCESHYFDETSPFCSKCDKQIRDKQFASIKEIKYHYACVTCKICNKLLTEKNIYIKNNEIYCEKDMNNLFKELCTYCNFPLEEKDKYIVLNEKKYHENCANEAKKINVIK
ncbi:hypothetical protein A3Q56_02958 [Intoshia linei]|uniref:PDZ domain-containing protein n=1 Tax=Intoshia linei TaxID=1819745 RepID=A0A177B4T5_9BILA|nr:hypothetical protein A3Q56_02958 [Intoshia linei]